MYKRGRAISGGAVAGLVATAPMTLTMVVLNQILPGRQELFPPERIVNKLAGKVGLGGAVHPFKWDGVDTLSHFSYGTGVGGVYGWCAAKWHWPPLFSGLLYGLGVWLVSYMGWLPLLGWLPPATRQSARRNCLMLTAHLVWGASLGWITSRLDISKR